MGPTRVKCPTCQREIDWSNAPYRPFCSDRCRLIDLGAWLSEQRGIPGESAASDASESEIDRTIEERRAQPRAGKEPN